MVKGPCFMLIIFVCLCLYLCLCCVVFPFALVFPFVFPFDCMFPFVFVFPFVFPFVSAVCVCVSVCVSVSETFYLSVFVGVCVCTWICVRLCVCVSGCSVCIYIYVCLSNACVYAWVHVYLYVSRKSTQLSQHKLAKPELAYGLAKDGTTDSQVGSQVEKSRKFHAYNLLIRFYNNRLLAMNSCWLTLGGQTAKTCIYLRSNLSSTKVNESPRKSMQVDASGWPNETQVERRSKACMDLRVHLARALVSVFLFPFYFCVCGSLSVTVLVFVLNCTCTSGDLCRLFLVIIIFLLNQQEFDIFTC